MPTTSRKNVARLKPYKTLPTEEQPIIPHLSYADKTSLHAQSSPLLVMILVPGAINKWKPLSAAARMLASRKQLSKEINHPPRIRFASSVIGEKEFPLRSAFIIFGKPDHPINKSGAKAFRHLLLLMKETGETRQALLDKLTAYHTALSAFNTDLNSDLHG